MRRGVQLCLDVLDWVWLGPSVGESFPRSLACVYRVWARRRTRLVSCVAFRGLGLVRPVLGTLRRRKCSAPAPVRRGSVPVLLRKGSLLKYTRAKANGATTFSVPVLRGLCGASGHGDVGTLVLAPAHRLTVRVKRSFDTCNGCAKLERTIVFNNMKRGPRASRLGHKMRVLITAPKQLRSLIGRNFVGLGTLRFFMLSRTSQVLSVKFVRSVQHVLGLLPTGQRALFFSTAVPPRVRVLTGSVLARPRGMRIAPTSSAISAVSRSICFIRGGRGGSLLVRLLGGPTVGSMLVFAEAGCKTSGLTHALDGSKVETRTVRKGGSRGTQRQTLANFGGRRLHMLVTASVTTQNVSISRLSRIVGCRLPGVPRACIRHVKQAKHTNRSNVTLSFYRSRRLPCLGSVRGLVKGDVPMVGRRPFIATSNLGTRGVGARRVGTGAGRGGVCHKDHAGKSF